MPDRSDQPAAARLVASYLLVMVLLLETTVWGAFLTPLRVGGTLVPVSLVVVVVANLGLGVAGGRLMGRAGAAVPGLVWLAAALLLGSQRAEGDLVISNGPVGLAYLLLGVVSSTVALGVTGGRLASPRHRGGR